ncbi:MAG: hypothetical protein GU356_00590 [Pyrobaculum sp.]|nr:hypothetical protein [Pyrobaculum sp.]
MRACLNSSSVSPASRPSTRGYRHLRRRRYVGCRVWRLDSSPRGLLLAVGEAEDGGDPWLCMAVPLGMPSRGLHLGPYAPPPQLFLGFYEVPLLERLVDINVLIGSITYRDPPLWVDQLPPERDLELGIGRHVAWHTLLHRAAVRRALQEM